MAATTDTRLNPQHATGSGSRFTTLSSRRVDPAPKNPGSFSASLMSNEAHEWPATLPWMEFVASHDSDLNHLFPLRGEAASRSLGRIRAAFRNSLRKSSRRTNIPCSILCPDACVIAVGSPSVAKSIAWAETLDIAVPGVAKGAPETYQGEHADALLAMASESWSQARRAAFKMLVYQVSNNLIAVTPFDEIDDDFADNDQYKRIVATFRACGPPVSQWVRESRRNRGSSWTAFKEKLFVAAVNVADLQLMQALLRCGVNPNQPVMTITSERYERPIQLAADSRMMDVVVATLSCRGCGC